MTSAQATSSGSGCEDVFTAGLRPGERFRRGPGLTYGAGGDTWWTRPQNRRRLADADAALIAAQAAAPPLPARADLEALVADLPALWAAATTAARDRKRLLRTLIADVTVLPETDPDKLRIGVRWHTGATDEILAARPLPPGPASRTPTAAVELIRRLGPSTSNDDLVTELNAAGLRTGHGRTFDIDAVQWVRHLHKIPVPAPYADGELSVTDIADRLQVSTGAVYYWISNGQLTARRGRGNRLCVTWNNDVEAACQRRIAASSHLKPQHVPAGGAV